MKTHIETLIGEPKIEEIGPHFNQTQFIGMMKRVSQAAFERKCKKNTNDNQGYVKALEAIKSLATCAGESEDITASYSNAQLYQDYKPLLKT